MATMVVHVVAKKGLFCGVQCSGATIPFGNFILRAL